MVLRAVIMRADRARAGGIAATLCAVQLPCLLLLRQPLADAAISLIGLLLLAIIQRMLFIRLTPPLPSAVIPSLSSHARTQWLTRGLGDLAFTLVALVASLSFHGMLFHSCPLPTAAPGGGEGETELAAAASALAASTAPTPAACIPPTSAFTAAFAALVGLAVGVDNAQGGTHEPLLPSGASIWPLINQHPYVRLRPTLPGAAAKAARLAVQSAIALLLLAWLSPTTMLRLGGAALSAVGSCVPCTAAHLLSESLPPPSLVPGISQLLGLLLYGWGFRMCCHVARSAVRIAYSTPLDFRNATYDCGEEAAASAEEALGAAIGKAAPPLTQHLGFYDAAIFAAHDPPRRRALFAIERGAAWPRFLKLLLAPIDAMTAALEAARKRRGVPTKLPSLPFVPRRLVSRVQIAHAMLLEHASRSSILGAAQLCVWAADALSCLIAASANEDALGTVQTAGSLGAALTSHLRCLQALESYVAGGLPRGGGVASRSQQSLALRVALGPPAQARAAGASQQAAALEAALSRSVSLLVQTFGQRVVLAANVPLELRPRLDDFLKKCD